MSLLNLSSNASPNFNKKLNKKFTSPSKVCQTNNCRKRVVMNLFTGIVQGLANVTKLNRKEDFTELQIEFPKGATKGVNLGASVAINGTCLSVTAQSNEKLSFDVMKETLRATNLGELEVGSRCNFERSACVGDEIGGHLVSGHVSCRACIIRKEITPNNTCLTFALEEPKFIKYILPKGFVSVDGCSLTVGEVNDPESLSSPSITNTSTELNGCNEQKSKAWFTVYLIPETLNRTVFGFKAEGESVNIEIDSHTQAIVDTVTRVLDSRGINVKKSES
mmetsp:Transcript_2227/g.3362  ORF Transcript_2227/g.3362 Transcript_2227/m.3362 type:complete len:278 (-) Transcript_2227:425-1258(-)